MDHVTKYVYIKGKYLKCRIHIQNDLGIKAVLNLAHEGRQGKCKVTKGAFCVGTDMVQG